MFQQGVHGVGSRFFVQRYVGMRMWIYLKSEQPFHVPWQPCFCAWKDLVSLSNREPDHMNIATHALHEVIRLLMRTQTVFMGCL